MSFHEIFALVLFLRLAVLYAGASDIRLDYEDNFDVTNYGAIGDGYTDESQAFQVTWDAACNAEVESSRIMVPQEMTFFLNPITFYGPCKAENINFEIYGTIIAPDSPRSWDRSDPGLWITFRNVNGLNIDGFGTIDGRGRGWWDQSCRDHPNLTDCTVLAPAALTFASCNSSSLSNMNFINSPQIHVTILACSQFKVDNVAIQSPEDSPNTDGIHVHESEDVSISNSRIGTGDDCISIGDYISNVEIAYIECGPGHGISIGSLGRAGNYVQVEHINVSHSSFTGTMNGARIKTWQVGRGYVWYVKFENLTFNSVQNPIIIDQNYCNDHGSCPETNTGVHISNVIYKEMYGTSSTDIAINLNCSQAVPCSDIYMESIHLESVEAGKQVTAYCSNAYGLENDVVPGSCLLDEVPLWSNRITDMQAAVNNASTISCVGAKA